jgi:hypothetical protein
MVHSSSSQPPTTDFDSLNLDKTVASSMSSLLNKQPTAKPAAPTVDDETVQKASLPNLLPNQASVAEASVGATPDSDSESVDKDRSAKARLSGGLRVLGQGLAGLALAIAAWELILQVAVESSKGISVHPAIGKVENPGVRLQTREGFSRIRLNSLGMRTVEPTPKPAGEYRILMLGDSYTRADEVSDGLSFSDRLQTSFDVNFDASSDATPSSSGDTAKDQSISKVQVINAGKPSASPASYLHAADFFNQTFAPDTTVVQLTEHDFILDMSNPESEFYLERQGGAQVALAGSNSALSEQYQVRLNEQFGSAEPLAQAVLTRAPWLRPLMQMSILRVGGRNLSAMLSPPVDEEAAAESETLTPAEQASLQAEDAAMVRWSVAQLKQQFPNLVLVFLPAMNYKDAGPVSSEPRNAAIENALTEAAAQQGVPLLNMREDFLAHYRSQTTHLNGFNNTIPGVGHLNSAGHELVAQRLIDYYNQPNSPLKRK